jgi:hypothetical protein
MVEKRNAYRISMVKPEGKRPLSRTRRIWVAQSAATCSRWFTARGFVYLEDGGDTFLRNVG